MNTTQLFKYFLHFSFTILVFRLIGPHLEYVMPISIMNEETEGNNPKSRRRIGNILIHSKREFTDFSIKRIRSIH